MGNVTQGVSFDAQLNRTGQGAAQTATPGPNPTTSTTAKGGAAMHTTHAASPYGPYQQDSANVPGFLKIPICDIDANVSNPALGIFARLLASLINPEKFSLQEAIAVAAHGDGKTLPELSWGEMTAYESCIAELICRSDLVRLHEDGSSLMIPQAWSYEGTGTWGEVGS